MTNIPDNRVKEEDLCDGNFIFDIHVLIMKISKPFLFERKLFNVKDRENVNIFWDSYINAKFYKHLFTRTFSVSKW